MRIPIARPLFSALTVLSSPAITDVARANPPRPTVDPAYYPRFFEGRSYARPEQVPPQNCRIRRL